MESTNMNTMMNQSEIQATPEYASKVDWFCRFLKASLCPGFFESGKPEEPEVPAPKKTVAGFLAKAGEEMTQKEWAELCQDLGPRWGGTLKGLAEVSTRMETYTRYVMRKKLEVPTPEQAEYRKGLLAEARESIIKAILAALIDREEEEKAAQERPEVRNVAAAKVLTVSALENIIQIREAKEQGTGPLLANLATVLFRLEREYACMDAVTAQED